MKIINIQESFKDIKNWGNVAISMDMHLFIYVRKRICIFMLVPLKIGIVNTHALFSIRVFDKYDIGMPNCALALVNKICLHEVF